MNPKNKYSLIRIRSSHNNMRTDSMTGFPEHLPEIGKGFVIFGDGLEFGTRIVHTTEVTDIRHVNEKALEFDTKNSTYLLVKEDEDGKEKI